METINPLRRFFLLLEIDRKDITYIYVYAIFAGLITLSLPLGVQAIIGLIAGGGMSAALIMLIAVVTIATALAGFLKIMQLTVTETIQRRIFARSAFDFSYRLPRMQSEEVSTIYPPELVNRFFDTVTIQKGLPKILIDLSSAVLQIIFGLILISFYHPFFVFFSLVLVTIVYLIFRITGPRGLKTSLQESKYKYKVAGWLEEIARSAGTFKLSGPTDLTMKKTDTLTSGYLDHRKAHFRILVTQYGWMVAFKTVITAALLALGSYLVIENQINIGQFVASEIVIILIMGNVEKLILTMDSIYDVLTGLEKLSNVTDIPLEDDTGLSFDEIENGGGLKVEIRNLSFQFPDADRPTIDNLNLEVQPGERICIAGQPGSGKSTLMRLLAGYYSNYRGAIIYNGAPMDSLDRKELRKHLGDLCTPENIFEGTVLENILLGKKGIGLKQAIDVAAAIGLDEYIQNLPKGYEFHLLPEGRNISGSLRTKILLARAVVNQPKLLIIERLFANINQEDREQFIQYLIREDKKWTLVLNSNELDIAARCDRIILMQEGKVVANGPYHAIHNNAYFKSTFIKNGFLDELEIVGSSTSKH